MAKRSLADQGHSVALTENFLPVELEGRVEMNLLVRVRVRGVNGERALTGVAAGSVGAAARPQLTPV
jgi:hypothetical protein